MPQPIAVVLKLIVYEWVITAKTPKRQDRNFFFFTCGSWRFGGSNECWLTGRGVSTTIVVHQFDHLYRFSEKRKNIKTEKTLRKRDGQEV
jgi:hypothetical protein